MDGEHAAWPPPDPLGEALHLLRMDGAFYSRAELTEPWGMTLTSMPGHLWFHVVTDGRVLLETGDGDPVVLRAGDCALVPHGEGHCLRSDPGVEAPDVVDLQLEHLSERYEVIRHGGGGRATTLICGALRFDQPAARHLRAILPDLIAVDGADGARAESMRSVVALMAVEARAFRPGGEAVITRLADVIVIQAIRAWIETDPAARTGWLGALQDRQIGRALALLHREPDRAWTVEALARELGMSRSSFAARFTALVGEPAMHYLARWRMHLAQHALETEATTVGELAARYGYRSEAAFARAFKRVVGVAPGRVRRAARAPVPVP